MSLLRLLTAGRCLVGLKDTCNRYRVNEGALLPKFESAPNPFRKTVLPGKNVQEALAESAAAASTVADCKVEARAGLAGRMTSGLRNLVKGGPAKASKSSRQPVQSELALDNIRVLRNDLSESDIEVVPVRKPALEAPAAAVGPQAPTKALGGWAERGRSLFRWNSRGQEAVRP